MSKQTEALKLALEALEGLEALLLSMGLTHLIVYGDAEKAITSLSQAIANEALDRMAENARELGLDYEPAQQEPVAWFELLREARDNCKASIVEEGISASRKEYRIDLEARLTAALNTSPPAQRKPWVGLTDVEIASACKKHGGAEWWWRDIEEYGRAIEAKLKEKNQ